jgi:hypothetical protein
MSYNVMAYLFYLLVTVYVIVVVGNALHKNGRPFLLNVFHQNISLADSVNNLLLTGYYLLNIGYCIIALRIWTEIGTFQQLTEILSFKIGTIVFLLGVMHLFNIGALIIAQKKYRNKKINIIINNQNQQP